MDMSSGSPEVCLNFDSIRPYEDAEFCDVLQRWGFFGVLQAPLADFFARNEDERHWLSAWFDALRQISTVADFQQHLRLLVSHMLLLTSDQLSISGLSELQPHDAYLFFSNHRDIVLDPTLVNYALAQRELPTARVAIGDNLISNPMVGDLMRLNKSFLVKRGLSDRKQKLQALNELSAYVRTSIQSGHSVWLAQREGRAKDGWDKTESAVLKMLHLSGRERQLDVAASFAELRLVPVTLSYEWHPCDVLMTKQRLGMVAKDDVTDILRGICQHKGRLHVAFDQPMPVLTDLVAIQQWLDQKIQQQYQLFPVNFYAASQLGENSDPLPSEVQQAIALEFERRFADESENVRREVMSYYARPVQLASKRDHKIII